MLLTTGCGECLSMCKCYLTLVVENNVSLFSYITNPLCCSTSQRCLLMGDETYNVVYAHRKVIRHESWLLVVVGTYFSVLPLLYWCTYLYVTPYFNDAPVMMSTLGSMFEYKNVTTSESNHLDCCLNECRKVTMSDCWLLLVFKIYA